MNERPIFRNIQHVPKVWGVTYLKLFATLGIGLLATTIGFSFTSGASAVVKVMVIGLGAVITLLLYGVCFWIDNTDHLDRDVSQFLKSEMNSQSLSIERLQFLHGETVDATSRSAARRQPARTKARKRPALR
jgi:ABC-type transport system involved in cytochrome bd biosynthesis fused ATPase/permease subunit